MQSVHAYLVEFRRTVEFFVNELDDCPHLWQFNVDDLDEAKYLGHIPWLGHTTAVDAVAVMKYFRRGGHKYKSFCQISENIVMEDGFCERTVQALIIWNFIMVRIQEYTDKFKRRPVDLGAMLTDFIDNGDIDPEQEY